MLSYEIVPLHFMQTCGAGELLHWNVKGSCPAWALNLLGREHQYALREWTPSRCDHFGSGKNLSGSRSAIYRIPNS